MYSNTPADFDFKLRSSLPSSSSLPSPHSPPPLLAAWHRQFPPCLLSQHTCTVGAAQHSLCRHLLCCCRSALTFEPTQLPSSQPFHLPPPPLLPPARHCWRNITFPLSALPLLLLSFESANPHTFRSPSSPQPPFSPPPPCQALLEQHGIPFVGTSSAAARNAFDKASQIPPRLLSPVFPAVCMFYLRHLKSPLVSFPRHLKSPLVSFPRCFLQYACAQHMKRCGFPTLPSFLIQAGVDGNDGDVALADWFTSNGLSPATGSVVVKPARAGSSVGVSVCSGAMEASQKARELISEGVDDRVVVEVFAAGGKEFTAIVLESSVAEAAGNGTRGAVCLIPTQVELTGFAASPATTSAAAATEGADSDSDSSGDIFDYRRKYLPTQQVLYSTPPRFPPSILSSLRASATRLFSSLSLGDCARLDGWFLPPSSSAYARVLAGLRASTDNSRGGNKEDNEAANNEDNQQGEEWEEEYKEGIVVFSDVNIVSGMEQTSFLFQQAALVGLSHSLILRWILASACSRYGLPLPLHPPPAAPGVERVREEGGGGEAGETAGRRQLVWVLFGGSTAERQVSLISGTNWQHSRAPGVFDQWNQRVGQAEGVPAAERQVSLISSTNVWLKLRACPQFDVQLFLLSPSHDSSSNTAGSTKNNSSGNGSSPGSLSLSERAAWAAEVDTVWSLP
ncbi:unnamed protein product [Closterium sp. Naga37s-1]|nr:unnamed protein product [Closterium sp. Naga37s-1]